MISQLHSPGNFARPKKPKASIYQVFLGFSTIAGIPLIVSKAYLCGAREYTDPTPQRILANISACDGTVYFDPRRVIFPLKSTPFDIAVLLDTCFGARVTKVARNCDPLTENLATTLDGTTDGSRIYQDSCGENELHQRTASNTLRALSTFASLKAIQGHSIPLAD